MRLPDFTLHQPRTLAQAFAVTRDGPFDWLGGGTDLLCNYKWRINVRANVISLRRVPELRQGLLGAGRTLSEVEHDPVLRARYPAIAQAASMIATPLIRQSATLGGNLLLDTRCWHFNQTAEWRFAHGSCLKAEADVCRVLPDPGNLCVAAYSGDLAPVLLAYDARVVLAGPSASRSLPLREFYAADGIRRFRDKKPDEVLVRAELPADAEHWTVRYQKLRLRQAFDFPEGGVAAAVRWDHGWAADIRLATTAYDSIPLLHEDLVAPHRGSSLDDEAIEQIAQALEETVRPMKNTSMSPSYRKKMARVLCRRALQDCRPQGV